MPTIDFTCNVCNFSNNLEIEKFHREIPSCSNCHSTVRIREIVYLLKEELAKRTDAQVQVLGLSDHQLISDFLGTSYNYINTFYDVDPILDISNPGDQFIEKASILISSDVMEHVMPPLRNAFQGHFRVLENLGTLILTTPYFTFSPFVEKYPWMNGYRVENDGQVIGKNSKGMDRIVDSPIFHGGPGNTLEMRLFTPETLYEGLTLAGFTDIKFHEHDIPENGIIRSNTSMGTITALKCV